MKKKTRKKRRIKKKVKKIFSRIIILIMLCILGGFITYSYLTEDNNTPFKEKTNITNNYIKITKATNLLNEKGKKVGNIDKDIILSANKRNNKLYKISNTNYYVSIDDIDNNIKYKDSINKNYVDFGKEISTKDKYNLLSEDKIIEVNNSDKYKIKYQDNDYYYIDLGNIYFKIKKDEIKEEKDYNVKDKISDKISVINFSRIENECSLNECYTKENVKKVLDYIEKNNYYTVNINDFRNWNFGNVKLKEKAVLLITPNSNEVIESLNKDYNNMINVYTPESGFTYLYNNKTNCINTNLSSLNNYNIYNNNTLDDIKKMIDGEEVNTKFFEGETANSVAIVNYHFFYDLSKGQTNCKEEICEDVTRFREHLNYLRDNGYTTLTMNQFVKWIYGEIDVPAKSVLITIDDGAYGTGFHNNNNLIPILDEYKMHATLFLISGWWDINNYKSSYLEIQSHTYNMHNKGSCGDAQLICANYQEIYNDLKQSIDVIGDKNTFCYPFYRYDNEAISAIKDLGFKIAFAGGNVKATRSSNKYTVPRYPIYDSTSLDRFIKMVS